MHTKAFCVVGLSILAVACSGGPPANLVDARAAYQRAAGGPASRVAPAQLHVARTSLDLAEKTYDDEGDSPNARDRAYVAQRKAELAEVHAAIALADQRTVLAARQTKDMRERNQLLIQNELATTRSQLANERNLSATQIAGEQQRRLQAERQAADAMAQLAGIASIKQESRGTVITLSGAVIFASGKADLLPTARDKLNQVATALKQADPNTQFAVEGHTDSRGSDELNQDLSTRRAANVRQYLISQGVPEARITSRGLGEANPVADNETAEGRANNRRVEIVVQQGTTAQQGTAAPASSRRQTPAAPANASSPAKP